MSKQLLEQLKDIPLRSLSPVSMEDPNETIKIYTGDFALRNQGETYNINGEIHFKWFPDMGVKFKGSFVDNANPGLKWLEQYEILIDNRVTGKIYVTGIDLTGKPTCSGEGNVFIWGESTIPVTEVSFSIPNMREFLGGSVKDIMPTGVKMQKSRLVLDDKPYNIVIDKLVNYKERKEKLSDSGGYLITYAGKITKKKGSINLAELHKWHDRFHHFLYFLNGRRVAPMFYTGAYEGQNIWTDYSNYTIDIHKYVNCWSDIMFLNDLPQLWKSYNKLWKEELDQDFLITAIHWYVEANSNAGMVDGSIILIQTALELIYNWLIVEHQKVIIGGDAEGMSAANKIRLLIYQFRISTAVPPAFKELAAIPNVQDGPEVFVKIRNALVHGQESKRAELKKITPKAKYQALQLGIWYVELALLYILGYKGKYNNRTDGNAWRNTGVLVPWVNDQSFKIGKPSKFTDDEINSFVELLEKQNKVLDPTVAKIKRCKLIGMGFSWGQPVAIGAVKPKTQSDFGMAKANLPELANDYEWEVGYFFTEPGHEGKRFSSTILNHLLKSFGEGRLMATTEIREGNNMINSLENRRFKQVGATWKSVKSGNDLRLFLRDLPEKQDMRHILDQLRPELNA
ncbi:hypothetical protein [Pedobacter antarcticus]|uniref:hypothetical protein n=1 Tax=Pedobacter antarcticus TaxID=34086 RepID=UPI00292F7635|nr:hypothetical protein [Pedobacter antarcticus]